MGWGESAEEEEVEEVEEEEEGGEGMEVTFTPLGFMLVNISISRPRHCLPKRTVVGQKKKRGGGGEGKRDLRRKIPPLPR